MPLEKSFQPVVSVVVAVYNAAPYLADCLNSILKQSLREIEVICVNDGSTDTSGSILQQFAAKDPGLLLSSRKNKDCPLPEIPASNMPVRRGFVSLIPTTRSVGWA